MTKREEAQAKFNEAAVDVMYNGATIDRLTRLKEAWTQLRDSALEEHKLIVDIGRNIPFGEAFSIAKRLGADEFNWRGDSYNTKTAEEAAPTRITLRRLMVSG